MLKQIGVRLEEDLIKKVKLLAIEEGITVQDIFKTALESYFDNKLTNKQDNKLETKQDNKLTNKQVKKKKEPIIKDKKETVPTFDASAALDALLNEEPDPFDERYFHVIKKVKFEGSPEYGDSVHKTNGRLSWFLEKGDSQCFDENRVMIPFTYRKAYGDIRRPNADEIKKIEEAYGKPVTIEK